MKTSIRCGVRDRGGIRHPGQHRIERPAFGGMVSSPDVHVPASQNLCLPPNRCHSPTLRTSSLALQSPGPTRGRGCKPTRRPPTRGRIHRLSAHGVLAWRLDAEMGGVLAWRLDAEMGGVLAWRLDAEMGGVLAWRLDAEMGGVLAWRLDAEMGGVLAWRLDAEMGGVLTMLESVPLRQGWPLGWRGPELRPM